MVVSLALLLSVLVLGTLSAQEPASEPVLPHLTGCVSNNMETFRCSWNVGTFQNLSQPGDLRLFYIKKTVQDLRECPQYGPPGTSQCFFSENHTSIWTNYRVQLFSRDRSVRYDDELFRIEDIVRPDPPIQLNWTLLAVAMSGTSFDVTLSWEAPASADVQSGWLTLQYQVQHRGGPGGPWKSKDLQRSAETSLYGLQTNVDYEVRVRSKTPAGKEFGPFSDSILIHVPSKVSRFPITILLIFAALCFIGVLMLVMQQKLMVILLPAVPGPKIRGIDPELLKKGDLSELMSVLGGHADLKMNNNTQSDPWVEFIDLDMEEEEEEPAVGAGADGGSPSSARAPLSSLGYRDDSDSGRDSCCCCDAPCEPAPRQRGPEEEPAARGPPEPREPDPVPAQQGPGDLYTQVSHVQRSGEVILVPGQEEKEEQEEEKGKENVKMDFRLAVVADQGVAGGGYSSERDAGKTRPEGPGAAPPVEYQLDPGAYTLAPPHSYTLVEGVDKQNSLLLRPNDAPAAPAARLCMPKAAPTPEGYLTPDLLRDITP